MEKDSALKLKSDRVHAIPQISVDERKQGKIKMMELYTEAVGCKRVDEAKEFVEKVFACMKRGAGLEHIHDEYATKKLCHSPLGNDYVCFCEPAV
ncbi:MAG: hypothetical protein A3A28_04805 [Candidatus Sungbacteria bacterium RIFCSPLOWO2_01_FULL_47_32]|nr:MAG: hypothetical protein A3A28_04805 [Candidatus Sungbacteria bacterium RIFCSPLOWO2_01_FULL_47_32]